MDGGKHWTDSEVGHDRPVSQPFAQGTR